MKQLTEKMLEKMKPGIFAFGTIDNDQTGCFMNDDGGTLRWVAVRGTGPCDWAIYVGKEEETIEDIRKTGDKVHTHKYIKRMVPCTEEAIEKYRE